MFERFEEARKPKRGWRFAAMAASVAAHGALAIAVVGWSFWKIEKVKTKGVVIMDYASPQVPVALGAPEAPPAPKVAKPKPQRPTATVQPRTQPTPAADPADDPATNPGSGNQAQGDANGTPGGDPNAPPGPPGPPGPVAPPTPSEPAKNVEASVLEAQRTAGERNIGLPVTVKRQMVEQGAHQTMAAVRLCLDESGVPSSIRIMKSTGFAEADEKIVREMQGWRYRPLEVNGRRMPACTAVTFVYRLE